MTIHAFTDGASRGNPGESGIGILWKDEKGRVLSTTKRYIGEATNNVAEYTALIECLKMSRQFKCKRLVVHSDSELMVRQVTGKYKVKDADLKNLFDEVQQLIHASPFEFEIVHIKRNQNKEADELANIAINLGQAAAAS